ncbi:hypothetical protein ACFX2I_031769 [Malus domestica]
MENRGPWPSNVSNHNWKNNDLKGKERDDGDEQSNVIRFSSLMYMILICVFIILSSNMIKEFSDEVLLIIQLSFIRGSWPLLNLVMMMTEMSS